MSTCDLSNTGSERLFSRLSVVDTRSLSHDFSHFLALNRSFELKLVLESAVMFLQAALFTHNLPHHASIGLPLFFSSRVPMVFPEVIVGSKHRQFLHGAHDGQHMHTENAPLMPVGGISVAMLTPKRFILHDVRLHR